MGYTNVKDYSEGKSDWMDAGLPMDRGLPTPQQRRESA